jgi:hypothetical protein
MAARPGPVGAPTGSTSGRLDLGDAIHEGWLAFSRAPWLFVAFSLSVNLLALGLQLPMGRIGNVTHPSRDPGDWALYLLGLALGLALNLWARLGLVRGAWQALNGKKPRLTDLQHWDRPAMGRLLCSWLGMMGRILLPALTAGLLFGLPLLVLRLEPTLQERLGREPTLVLGLTLAILLLIGVALSLVIALIMVVNQLFLVPIVLLERLGGPAALARGRRLVHPQWPLVLLLLILESLLLGIGLFTCVVGVLPAWPLVLCISTAAYRQLIKGEPAGSSTLQDTAPLMDGA